MKKISGVKTWIENTGDSMIPKRYRKTILDYHKIAGIKKVPYLMFGISYYVVLVFSAFININLFQDRIFSNLPYVLSLILALATVPVTLNIILFLIKVLYKVYLDFKINKRKVQMEAIFPDFLAEVSLNIKAGLSLEKAFQNALEKDFGVLGEEIDSISRDISLGASMSVAMKEFTKNYDSELMEEAFELILLSWKKGTNTAPLIDRIADNINDTNFLKRKVVAGVTSYRIFIGVVTLVITPAMFAVVYHLIDLIRAMFGRITSFSSTGQLPLLIYDIRINDTHLVIFSAMAIGIVSISAAIIDSIIRTGDIKNSTKEIITYPMLSIISYRFFMLVFSIFFGWFKI